MSRQMRTRAVSRWASGAFVVVIALLGGCERKSAETKEAATKEKAPPTAPGAPSAAGQAAAPITPFEPPKLGDAERRGMAMALEMKISSAYYEATNSPTSAPKLAILGALYLAHGLPAQAASCFDRAAVLDPNETTCWIAAGLAYERAGQPAKAVAAYDRAIALQRDYLPPYLRAADLLVAQEPARAAHYYEQVLERNPAHGVALAGLGRVAAAQGRREEALQHFRKALAFNPDDLEAQRAFGEFLKATGQTEQAEKYLRAGEAGLTDPFGDDPAALAVLRTGLDPGVLCRDALLMAQQGTFDRAEATIRQAVEMGATVVQAGEARGVLRARQGRFEEARTELEKALQAQPKLVTARVSLAHVLLTLGELGEAERLLREVLAEQPTLWSALNGLAELARRQSSSAEPERFLREAVAANPQDVKLHYRLAEWLANQQRPDEALVELRRVLELQPEYLAARSALASVLLKQGDTAGARRELEEALRLNPKFAEGYLRLAVAALDNREPREAERVIRQGLEKLPDAASLFNFLAWILATSPDDAQRNGAEAVRSAEKANELARSRDPSYLDTLGAAYAEAGRFQDAVRTTRQAVDLANQLGLPELAKVYQDRVTLYEQSKPFHQTK